MTDEQRAAAETERRRRVLSNVTSDMGSAVGGLKQLSDDPAFRGEVDAWFRLGCELMKQVEGDK